MPAPAEFERPTEVLQVDALLPAAEPLERAAEVLRRGGLVAFPTETVYGLGAHALDAAAVARIFSAKGRPASNPVIVHVAEVAAARELAEHWPPVAERLAEAFWPGPLTLVVPRGRQVPEIVTAGGSTVALRCPAHPVAHALLAAAGLPIAAPSANRSTRLSPTSAEHVLKQLRGRIDLVLDGGPASGGLESTVVDLSVDPPRLLRPGLISAEALAAVLGGQLLVGPTTNNAPEPARSPGQMEIHYAPTSPLELADAAAARVSELIGQGVRVGWLARGEAGPPTGRLLERLDLLNDAAEYAAQLYAALHLLEDRGVQRIVVSRPPNSGDWRAVQDRLKRASAQATAVSPSVDRLQ